MRWVIKLGSAAILLTAVGACRASPMDPYVDVVAETLGSEFVLGDRLVTIPVSIKNLSENASYYVSLGPGGLCASLDRLGHDGWDEQQVGGTCHPRTVTEIAPGERMDSQVWMEAETGVFRFGLDISDDGSRSEFEAREWTNAFTIRP